jgi:hypothetical protein
VIASECPPLCGVCVYMCVGSVCVMRCDIMCVLFVYVLTVVEKNLSMYRIKIVLL